LLTLLPLCMWISHRSVCLIVLLFSFVRHASVSFGTCVSRPTILSTIYNLAYDFILVVFFLFFFKFYFCIWFYCTVYMCHTYCVVLVTVLVLLLNKFDLIWWLNKWIWIKAYCCHIIHRWHIATSAICPFITETSNYCWKGVIWVRYVAKHEEISMDTIWSKISVCLL